MFLFIGQFGWDISMMAPQALGSHPAAVSPDVEQGRIEGHPIHPGCEFGITPKRRIGFPQLTDDLLAQILAIIHVPCVKRTYLVNDVLVLLDPLQKPVFFIRIHHTFRLPIHTISYRAVVKTTDFYKEFGFLTDQEALTQNLAGKHVLTYGTMTGNLWLAEHATSLPIRVEPDFIDIGELDRVLAYANQPMDGSLEDFLTRYDPVFQEVLRLVETARP